MRQTFRSLFNWLRRLQEHQASASKPAADGAAPVGAADATSPGNWPAQTLLIRYDSIALPETVQNWLHASRYVAHRAQGAEYFHALAANADPDFYERLQWAALCLYQDGLDDDLNQLAMQAQLRLSEEAKDPDIRAYAGFMGQMWPSMVRQQRLSEEQVRAESPSWMADDWMLLDMARAGSDEERLRCFNQLLSSKGLSELELRPPDHSGRLPAFDRLESRSPPPSTTPDADAPSPLVSIIVPVYNAQDTVETSIRSLLAQTWQNIEIIAVDDASSDGSLQVLERLAAGDTRVRVLRSAVNQGAYPSRNKGLKEARGEYVTVADSDDWHHPQKIECQVRSLLSHPRLIANMSGGFRAIDNLQPVARARPFFKQSNLSSLLFPRLRVMEALGGWNAVRFGADTEFFNRLAMVFGADAICTLDLPLFVGRSRPDSLTNDPLHGYMGHDLGARKAYVACYRHFQRIASREQLRYSIEPDAPLPFPVPALAKPVQDSASSVDRVISADLRDPIQAAWAINQQQIATAHGQHARLMHETAFRPQLHDDLSPFLSDYLYKQRESLVTIGEDLHSARRISFATAEPLPGKLPLERESDIPLRFAAAHQPLNNIAVQDKSFDLQALYALWSKLPEKLRISGLDLHLKRHNVQNSWLSRVLQQNRSIGDTIEAIVSRCQTVGSFNAFHDRKEGTDSTWTELIKIGEHKEIDATTPSKKNERLLQALKEQSDYRLHALLLNFAPTDEAWLLHINAYLEAIGAPCVGLRAGKEERTFRITGSNTEPMKVNDGPLVSVIMPCFNAEEHLRWAAGSILRQTWTNIELILVDDCSTDRTPTIIRELAESDPRVTPLRTSFNAGPYVAKNLGVSVARGDYITGHDADDWATPERIYSQIAHQVALGQPVTVGHMIRLSPGGQLVKIGNPNNFSRDGVLRLASISALFDSDFFRSRLGSWDCVRYGADSELLSRASIALGHDVAFANVMTMFCLNREDSLTNRPGSAIVDGQLSETRLAYRSSWQAWHARLGQNETYLPLNLGRHYFGAPVEMQNTQL